VWQRHLADSSLDDQGNEFARELVEGVRSRLPEIDDIIRQHATAFPLEDMAAVDRNVLRLAIYEVLFDTGRAPLRVAINEAVEIAKGYGSESSGRFVNGVVGAVALEAAERHDSIEPGEAGESGAGD
jgi:transcription antitermination protein NusB